MVAQVSNSRLAWFDGFDVGADDISNVGCILGEASGLLEKKKLPHVGMTIAPFTADFPCDPTHQTHMSSRNPQRILQEFSSSRFIAPFT